MQRFTQFISHPLTKYVAIALAVFLSIGIITGLVQQNAAKVDALHIALAAPLTSNRSEAAKEMVQSVQLYLDAVNQQGGINGRPLKLLVYDDRDYPTIARDVAREIEKSQALMVLGHLTSTTSVATAPLYKALQIPVITGTASADTLTQDNPYYFRTAFNNTQQGNLLALYAQQVLKFNTANVIYSNDTAGQSLRTAFEATFKQTGTLKHSWEFYEQAEDWQKSLNEIVNDLAKQPEPGIVFLAMSDTFAKEFIVAIRQRNLTMPLLGNDTLARETFPALFDQYDEEKRQPGYFVNELRLAVPLILDSAGVDAQAFASNYQRTYGKLPSYVAGGYYDAAAVAVRAILNANIQNTATSLKDDRQLIRDRLEAINSPEVAVKGLSGDLYFNETHDTSPRIRFGQFVGRSLISASTQLSPVKHLELVNLEREIKSGNIIPVTNLSQKERQYFWRQEVVYAGIDINKLNRLDQSKSSFTADFYVWMRYNGSDDATGIEFPTGIANSLDVNLPLFDPQKPTRIDTINGQKYRLYQVRGEFRNSYDLLDYPFDQQTLKLYFENVRVPSDRLIYAIDTFGLKLLKSDPEEVKKPYQSLQLWNFKTIQYAQESFSSTSTRGNPQLFDANLQVDYPGLSATITLQRRFTVFLVKVLLPLGLLVLVLFSTLFFSENMAKERLTVAISALLSSALLLTAINAQLADTGYTVAIEYGFYLFFGLCLFCIVIGLILERLRVGGYKTAIQSLNKAAQFLYVAIVLGTVATYWVAFGSRLQTF